MEGSIVDTLPDEVLLMIFDYISPVELSLVTTKVCIRWKNLIISRIRTVKKSRNLTELQKSVKVMLVLQPDHTVLGANVIIAKALQLCPQIRELTITREFPLVPSNFRELSKLVHLRHLDVFVGRHILDEKIVINKNITSFVANDPITTGFIENLSDNKLTSFHMCGRLNVVMPREMELLFEFQSAYLRDLTLRCSNMLDKEYEVLTLCVNLVSLQLHSCSQLSLEGIKHIAALPPIRRLHITGTIRLCNLASCKMIEQLPTSIIDLNLSATPFDVPHAEALSTRLPELRVLELWRVSLPTDHMVRLASRLRCLEFLDTDVTLRSTQIRALERLPSLVKLRCHWKNSIITSLSLISARLILCDLRSSSEGPSAEFFYYWSRYVLPEYLPCSSPERSSHNRDMMVQNTRPRAVDMLEWQINLSKGLNFRFPYAR